MIILRLGLCLDYIFATSLMLKMQNEQHKSMNVSSTGDVGQT